MKSQRDKILELLKSNEKVNSYELTYKYHIKQAPTRVYELRELGYDIYTSPANADGSVDYSLLKKTPLKTQPEGTFKWIYEGNIARKVYL